MRLSTKSDVDQARRPPAGFANWTLSTKHARSPGLARSNSSTQTAAAGAVARRPAQYNTDPVSRPGSPSLTSRPRHQRPYLPSVPFLSRAPPSPKRPSRRTPEPPAAFLNLAARIALLSTNPSACLPAGHFALLGRCRSLDTTRLRAGGGASSSTRLFDVPPLRPQEPLDGRNQPILLVMTTVVAAPPVTAALAPSTVEHPLSTRAYATIAPSGTTAVSVTPSSRGSKATGSHSPPTMSELQLRRTGSDGNNTSGSKRLPTST